MSVSESVYRVAKKVLSMLDDNIHGLTSLAAWTIRDSHRQVREPGARRWRTRIFPDDMNEFEPGVLNLQRRFLCSVRAHAPLTSFLSRDCRKISGLAARSGGSSSPVLVAGNRGESRRTHVLTDLFHRGPSCGTQGVWESHCRPCAGLIQHNTATTTYDSA